MFDTATVPTNEIDDKESIVELDIDNDGTSCPPSWSKSNPSQLDLDRTYVPAFSSTYEESDKTPTDQGDEYNADDLDCEDAQKGPDTGTTYNLRNQPRMHYSALAQVNIVEDVDRPELEASVKSLSRQMWIEAIKDEFDTLNKINTCV